MAKAIKMIEVVVVTKFKDKENENKLRKVGEKFEITESRYKEIVAAGKKAKVEYVAIPAEKTEEANEGETAEKTEDANEGE